MIYLEGILISLFIQLQAVSTFSARSTPYDSSYTGEQGNVPVVITAARSENKNAPIAIFISGDGGWYRFEQGIANDLAASGIPTIGIDSKKYFWSRKTPDETAGDILKLIDLYSKKWGRDSLLFIGYSFGAEIIPFLINRLPPAEKSYITSAVLLSPTNATDFDIHLIDMLGVANTRHAYNVTEELNKIRDVPILIIFGQGEKTKLPEALTGKTIKIEKIPGDHHYKFNIPLIIQTMKKNSSF